jgi:hypothetical protein
MNARIQFALSMRDPTEPVLDEAGRAVLFAPYALDVKANLGSLQLHMAAKGGPDRALWLNRARDTFKELETTGWDKGFVHYRLATIERVRGNFDIARHHLEVAKDPGVRDVWDDLDDEEHLLNQRDTTISAARL